MNAQIKPAQLMAQVQGELLHSGYQYDDELVLDLYGSIEDGEHIVSTVIVAGTTANVTVLFSARKLELLGLWIDVEGKPQYQEAQRQRGYEIARLPK